MAFDSTNGTWEDLDFNSTFLYFNATAEDVAATTPIVNTTSITTDTINTTTLTADIMNTTQMMMDTTKMMDTTQLTATTEMTAMNVSNTTNAFANDMSMNMTASSTMVAGLATTLLNIDSNNSDSNSIFIDQYCSLSDYNLTFDAFLLLTTILFVFLWIIICACCLASVHCACQKNLLSLCVVNTNPNKNWTNHGRNRGTSYHSSTTGGSSPYTDDGSGEDGDVKPNGIKNICSMLLCDTTVRTIIWNLSFMSTIIVWLFLISIYEYLPFVEYSVNECESIDEDGSDTSDSDEDDDIPVIYQSNIIFMSVLVFVTTMIVTWIQLQYRQMNIDNANQFGKCKQCCFNFRNLLLSFVITTLWRFPFIITDITCNTHGLGNYSDLVSRETCDEVGYRQYIDTPVDSLDDSTYYYNVTKQWAYIIIIETFAYLIIIPLLFYLLIQLVCFGGKCRCYTSFGAMFEDEDDEDDEVPHHTGVSKMKKCCRVCKKCGKCCQWNIPWLLLFVLIIFRLVVLLFDIFNIEIIGDNSDINNIFDLFESSHYEVDELSTDLEYVFQLEFNVLYIWLLDHLIAMIIITIGCDKCSSCCCCCKSCDECKNCCQSCFCFCCNKCDKNNKDKERKYEGSAASGNEKTMIEIGRDRDQFGTFTNQYQHGRSSTRDLHVNPEMELQFARHSPRVSGQLNYTQGQYVD